MTEKMFITKTPALPGTCAVCNTHAKGNKDYIDFGTDLDWYGAILICADCAVNMAKLVGFVPVAEVHQQHERAERNALGWRQETEKVKALEHLIASYNFDRHLNSVASSRNDDALSFEFETQSHADSDSVSGEVDESGFSQQTTV